MRAIIWSAVVRKTFTMETSISIVFRPHLLRNRPLLLRGPPSTKRSAVKTQVSCDVINYVITGLTSLMALLFIYSLLVVV